MTLRHLVLVAGAISLALYSPPQAPGDPPERGLSDQQKPITKPNADPDPKQNRPAQRPAILEGGKASPPQSTSAQPAQDINQKLAEYTADLALFTKLLVGATILLAIPAFLQLFIARSANRRQLRAYIGVGFKSSSIKLGNRDDPAYEPVEIPAPAGYEFKDFFYLRFRNFGQTPAYNVTSWVSWKATQYGEDIPVDFAYPDIDTAPNRMLSRQVLHKDQTHVGAIPINNILPFKDAMDKLLFMHVYGHIDYSDIYNRNWRTNFCYRWQPNQDPSIAFVPCWEHNNETQQD